MCLSWGFVECIATSVEDTGSCTYYFKALEGLIVWMQFWVYELEVLDGPFDVFGGLKFLLLFVFLLGLLRCIDMSIFSLSSLL